jgi:hypothetical protein
LLVEVVNYLERNPDEAKEVPEGQWRSVQESMIRKKAERE